jgi:hypothetical protein
MSAQPNAASEALDQALGSSTALNRTAGSREYLEASVVPTLIQGLTALTRVRPENPVDYLAIYLLKRNPNKQVTVEVPVKST